MAKRTIHLLVDDLDGGEADETVTFALDGVQYEIDLSSKHAAQLREKLDRYVSAATKLGRSPVSRVTTRRGGAPVSNKDQNKAIRDWAQAKGIEVSDRGRIRKEIVDQFHAEAGR